MDSPALSDLSEAIVRTIREPLLILDADFQILAANPAFYGTFHTEPHETLGHSIFEIGGGQWDISALRQLLQNILPHDDAVENFELEHVFRGIGTRHMALNARRLDQAAGGAQLILLAIADDTERVNARQEIERSNQELERFAYVASHDLQEPLRMVASYTRLLARRYEGQLDERADKYIRYAAEGAERMKSLIQDLLAYSRIGTQGGDLVPTDAAETFAGVLQDYRLRIQKTGARVTQDSLPHVMADPPQLRQLFQNLLENALKFSGNDRPPQVHLSGRRDGRWAHMSFRDEGIGIEPEYFEKVFVVFQRLHGRETEGTGIGLALCKRIVERHGGRLWVESEVGKGTTFHFTLPAMEQV